MTKWFCQTRQARKANLIRLGLRGTEVEDHDSPITFIFSIIIHHFTNVEGYAAMFYCWDQPRLVWKARPRIGWDTWIERPFTRRFVQS